MVATCLLDPGDPQGRVAAARWGFAGKVAPSLLPPVARVAGDLRLPIRWLVRMNRMSNDPDLTRMCESDPLGGRSPDPAGISGRLVHLPACRARGLHRSPGHARAPGRRPLDPTGAQPAVPRPHLRADAGRPARELRALADRGARTHPADRHDACRHHRGGRTRVITDPAPDCGFASAGRRLCHHHTVNRTPGTVPSR